MTDTLEIIYTFAIILSYLLGSIPSAILVARIMRLPDPRQIGSGNPGATNVLRTGNKKAAAITLVSDLLKGLIPLLIARLLGFDLIIICLMGMAAVIGHMYPVFLNFKGGKGVATTLGVLFGISWPLAVLWIVMWLSTARLSGYSSLAAIVAMTSLPVVTWLLNFQQAILVFCIAICALVLWRHRSNINNLLSGKESKIKLFNKT